MRLYFSLQFIDTKMYFKSINFISLNTYLVYENKYLTIYNIALYCIVYSEHYLCKSCLYRVNFVFAFNSTKPNFQKPHKCNLIAWFKTLDCVLLCIWNKVSFCLILSPSLPSLSIYSWILFLYFIYLFIFKQCTFHFSMCYVYLEITITMYDNRYLVG